MSAISFIKECINEQMSEMTTDHKLMFLTDIFTLTEDMRHELSVCDSDMDATQDEQEEDLRGSSCTRKGCSCGWENTGDEANDGIYTEEELSKPHQ